jgi:hypothetical protein
VLSQAKVTSKNEIFGNLFVRLAYARFEVFTAVLLKIKVFCHWRIVTGVSKFILPSPSASSTQRRMLVPVQGTEVLLMPRRNAGRLS